ncbi:MAG: hypothetical protein K9G76_02955 [Bacteroidales bacterium]|nr:hypothetical protein [Bacteroidales bacterium]MCF8402753.1 hypothetical protein [Bacteroidales bacterium]
MNTLLVLGSVIVTAALISYSIGIITEQVKKVINSTTLIFVSIGILLDITATIFMILGSPNSPFTFHGFLGYSALAVMLADVIFIWRTRLRDGKNAKVKPGLHLFSRYAYLWWVIAYITGALIVVLK